MKKVKVYVTVLKCHCGFALDMWPSQIVRAIHDCPNVSQWLMQPVLEEKRHKKVEKRY